MMLELMEQSFAGGSIVDIIFGFMAIEVFAMIAYHRITGQGLNSYEILGLMIPGIFCS